VDSMGSLSAAQINEAFDDRRVLPRETIENHIRLMLRTRIEILERQMDLERAVDILNHHDHNDCNDWVIKSTPMANAEYRWIEGRADSAADPSGTLMIRTEFEAKAIAREFLRLRADE
jgi:hypothetical protein